MHSCEVVVDSSSWIRAMRENAVGALEAKLVRCQATLVVPKETTAEFLAQPDAERAWLRLSQLAQLAKSVPVKWADGFGPIVLRERQKAGLCPRPSRRRKRQGPIGQLPSLPLAERASLLPALERREAFLSHWPELTVTANWQLHKAESLTLDQQARAIAHEWGDRLNSTEETFRAHVATYPWGLLESPAMAIFPSQRAIETAIKNPARFKCALTWAIAQDLTVVGIAQAQWAPKTLPLKSVDQNAWTDNKIAGISAYSDVLLSEDSEQRYKANLAAKALGLKLVAQSLEDYLAGVQ